MKTILCLLLVGIVAALAAPPTPTFPTAFNTTFDFRSHLNHTNNVGFWEYDLTAKAERFFHRYHHGAQITVIRRYDLQKQYHVEKRFGKTECFEAALTGDLDYPSFKDYTYGGTFEVHGEHVDMWKTTKGKEIVHYFDIEKTEIPFEVRTETTSMEFFNFKKGPQPSSAFAPPSDCKTYSVVEDAITL
eukprot:TRINITY_DN376_c0_g1_i1.p1 TRINITY_DN376_c0_g1~~TRINITY_DN376_c0_g1_i1.p1  ORF type:complete len:188 (+),score=61.00 TRINITY_DN376_c0_g1_i1:628-1191(+)